jgi:hypothetical protein
MRNASLESAGGGLALAWQAINSETAAVAKNRVVPMINHPA